MPRARVLLAGVALAVAAVGPGTGVARADWTTFGGSLARTGAVVGARSLTPKRASTLKRVWRTQAPGAINTQPLAARGVKVGPHRRDLLYVGTEHGWLLALDAHRGGVVWRRKLASTRIGVDCAPSPDHRFGVTGTPVLDRGTGRIYAADARGRVWAFGLGSGRTVRGWPVRVTNAGTSEYVWSALALNGRRLYVPIASPCDEGTYHGGIALVDTHTRAARHWNTTPPGVGGGAIWGWGGVAIDRGDGDVYAATGNAAFPATEDAGYGEHVVRLTRDLVVRQSDDPLSPPFAIGDRDFGTTPVLFHAAGCPPQLVVMNKAGMLFLYDRDRLAQGARQAIRVAAVTGDTIPLIGVPAFDTGRRALVFLNPTSSPATGYTKGIVALRLTSACRFARRWQHPTDRPASGSAPTVAAGVAWLDSGRRGRLQAFALSDGRPLWARRLSTQGAFATPTHFGSAVYAADWHGGAWAFHPAKRR